MSAGNTIWPMKTCMGTYERLGPKSVDGKCVFDVIDREVNKNLYISLYYGIQIIDKNQETEKQGR